MVRFWDAKGWKRRRLACLFGAFATLALPPIYLLAFLVPAFSGLLLLVIHAKSKRQAFLDGWWWGLGHFTTGLYWICISLYVDPKQFAWLTPFALFGLPSIVAIYIGLVTLALFYFWGASASPPLRSPSKGVVASAPPRVHASLLPFIFAALFAGAEYLRTYLFTGFPWNLIGYVWTVSDVTIQSAWLVGIYGLGFITVFAASAPALFSIKEKGFTLNVFAVVVLAAMVVFGVIRLDHNPTIYSTTKIRVVQPSIAQKMKWDSQKQAEILHTYAMLTGSPGIESVNIVVWPEAAIPIYLQSDSAGSRMIGNMLPKHGLLLAGGVRGVEDKDHWKAWNSLFAINHDGEIVAQYDKHHLVPFGEFIPFRNILPVENIAGGLGDFSRGTGPTTLAVDNVAPFSPLICYEAIFPDEATDKTGHAKWLLNITDDAWFGVSSGPYQHLEMARMRAVENALPLVRAANTGISAVIDPMGRVLTSMPLEATGIMDFYLPISKP